MHFNDTLERH